jgi:hypothetical protein
MLVGLKKQAPDIRKVGRKEARLEWATINNQWHKL